MEVPAKLRSVLADPRYLLLAFILTLTTLFISCSGGSDTTITITDPDAPANIGSIILTIDDDSFEVGGVTSTVTAEVFNFDGDPVPDGTIVNFTVKPVGIIPAAVATKNGIATTILTSDTVAGQYTLTAKASTAQAVAFGEFVPGLANAANTSLAANPNSIPADGISTSLITLVAKDEYNNPVIDGTSVNFYADNGAPATATGTTSNGIATFTLTSSTDDNTVATVTAVVGPVTRTVQVGFGAVVGGGGEGSGTANSVILRIEPTSIRVKNSGGNETTVIEATVKDEELGPVTDCGPENNIRFAIINGPGGGEKLDGAGAVVEKHTVNGVATATLSSGTVSGTVNIQVSAILNGECTDDDIPASGYYATAFSSNIVIEAGPPTNITLFQDNLVTPNDDGSISQTITARVVDLHGNPVENGTAVYFGLVDNPNSAVPPYLGYLSSGTNGVTNGTSLFTSATNSFVSDGLMAEDILIILEGPDEGGHRIASVNNNTSLTLYNTMNGSQTGLNFVAGSAELGLVCGSALTGNLERDASCAPTALEGNKGFAHTKLTWVPQAIFKPYHLYAEAVGGDVGDTLADSYPAVAPVDVNVTISPSSVRAGDAGIAVVAEIKDGEGNPIQGENIFFSTSNTGVAFISGANPVVTDTAGKAATTIDTGACLTANTNVTITAARGSFVGTGSLSVSATAPTANFTFSTAPGTAAYSDTSTTPAGTTLTAWSWIFNGGAPAADNTSTPPLVTYAGAPGTFQTSLTVTNNLGCTSASVSKSVAVPAP